MIRKRVVLSVGVWCAVSAFFLAACEDNNSGGSHDNGPNPPQTDITGQWLFQICDTPFVATLQQDNGAVRGTVTAEDAESAELVGTVSGNEFDFTVELDGMINVVGNSSISSNSMSGTVQQQGSTCAFSASR